MTTEWDPLLAMNVEAALRGSPEGSKSGAQPADLDLWLVAVLYEFVAAQSSCRTCGGQLGRQVRVVTCSPGPPSERWRVSVVTRCGGWRRHRHVAEVVRPSRDLVLGPLVRC
jgi:hypothetical protein